MTDAQLLATLHSLKAAATKGRVRVEGTIYQGFEACLVRNGRTIAQVADYHDAAMFAALADSADRILTLAEEGARAKAALERLSKLTPQNANAHTAADLYLTVRAIADTALAALTPAQEG